MSYLIALHMFRLDFGPGTTVSLKVLVDGEVVSEMSREMGSHNDWWEALKVTWGKRSTLRSSTSTSMTHPTASVGWTIPPTCVCERPNDRGD